MTPIRKLFTPSRSSMALPTLTTPAKIAAIPVSNRAALDPSPAAAATLPTTPAVSSSSKKSKKTSTPKSVRIELPTPTSDVRKHALPKSSLSISVTAEDVSVALPPLQEVAAPSAAQIDPTAQPEKSESKRNKKRKRSTEQEEESPAPADEVAPAKEKAPKKRKVADDAAVAVGGADATIDGITHTQRKAISRAERRKQKAEELRKAAILAAEETKNVKLAQSLVSAPASASAPAPAPAPVSASASSPAPVSDSANVSVSVGVEEGDVSRRQKTKSRRREARKVKRDRSLTEASDSLPSEDVIMDDSAIREETVEHEPAVESPAPAVSNETASEVIIPSHEPVVSAVSPIATTPEPAAVSQLVSGESKSNRKNKRKNREQNKEANSTMDQADAQLARSSIEPTPPEQQKANRAEEEPAVADQPSPSETSPLPVPAATSTPASSVPEPKSNRKNRRKSEKADQTTSAIQADVSTTDHGSAETAVGDDSLVAKPSTNAVVDTPSASKRSKRQASRTSAAAALAEWRAKHSQSSNADVSISQPTVAQDAQDSPSPAIVQSNLPPVDVTPPQETAAPSESTGTKETTDADKPSSPSEEQQRDEESEGSSTPPASSAQIPLPPASQQIARLPSSSPESYSSESAESQDAWQKAHRRMRTPGSEDLEPEGDDDDDEDEDERKDPGREDVDMAEDIEEPTQSRDTPEAIASFGEPEEQDPPMEVDAVEEDAPSPSQSTPRPASSPTPQPTSPPVVQEEVAESQIEADQPEENMQDATPQPGTPHLFSMTQDPIIPPTQTQRAAHLSLTDLAAPSSPPMPSTGVVAFQDAMEEDAMADQAAMDSISGADDTTATAVATDATEASDVTQSGTDSAASQLVSQSQTSTASPRRLRSRMRMRDGSKPETDPLKPLPLPTATPKKRGRQPKVQSQADPVVQVVRHFR